MLAEVLVEIWPLQQKTQESGTMESLLNMPMMRTSKPWNLWSMKADTKKCFVLPRGVIVILLTEDGHEGGRLGDVGKALSEWYIFRVSKKMMPQVTLKRMKAVKRL